MVLLPGVFKRFVTPALGTHWDRKQGGGAGWEGDSARLCSVFHRPDAAMPGPWLLLAMALTLTLTDVPSGSAQPEVAQQEAAMVTEYPGLDDLLRQAERLLLLREDLQRLRGDQGDRESGEGRVCPELPG